MPWGGRSTIIVSARRRHEGGDQAADSRLGAQPAGARRPVSLRRSCRRDGRRLGQRPAREQRCRTTRDTSRSIASWKDRDTVTVEIPGRRQAGRCRRACEGRRGKVAVERGPIVYCAESPDVDGERALDVMLDATRPLEAVDRRRTCSAASRSIHARGAEPDDALVSRRGASRLIPYYLWANRGAAEMSVWLPTREYAPGDVGPAGGLIFYENPNYATDGWRYLEAAPFDQSAGAKWGCFRRRFPERAAPRSARASRTPPTCSRPVADPGTAAQLCATLQVNGIGGWFLPSRDELLLMYRHLRATGAAAFGDRGVTDNFTLLDVVATDRRHGRPHRFRRSRPRPLRRQGLSAPRAQRHRAF